MFETDSVTLLPPFIETAPEALPVKVNVLAFPQVAVVILEVPLKLVPLIVRAVVNWLAFATVAPVVIKPELLLKWLVAVGTLTVTAALPLNDFAANAPPAKVKVPFTLFALVAAPPALLEPA